MIINYNEFLVEKLIMMINESEVVYSSDFRKLLKDIDSPIAKILTEVEMKDLNISNNYFDISNDKDTISFITDRKAKELIGDSEKYAIYSGGTLLTHNLSSNGSIFKLLEYDPKGSEPYHPREGEKGEILSRAISPVTGNVFVKLKFPGGECVINEEKLLKNSTSKEVWSKYRQTIRTGRGIKALLRSYDKKFTDSEIEDFVNKYKSAFDRMNDIYKNFDLVSGDDIAYWYNSNNYLYGCNRGTLGNSCMSGVPASYFQIYTKNPDVCSLLILRSEESKNKIKARALVWKLKDPEIVFMDRVYSHSDSDMQLFKDYAKHNKWSRKINMDSSPDPDVIGPDGLLQSYPSLNVYIKSGAYSKYPYVDTLKYYDTSSGLLSTEEDGICLEDTGGSYVGGEEDCEYCDGEGRVECPECYGSGEVDCGECDGDGEIECDGCDGKGEIECDGCGGSGEDENGDTCKECGGEGKTKCDECDGKGKNGCGECDGTGKLECDECNGSGRVDCPDCNG